MVAKKVPLKAGIFKVPMTVETGKSGSSTKPAGVCTRPPPPTIASINPAAKAAKHKRISVVVINVAVAAEAIQIAQTI